MSTDAMDNRTDFPELADEIVDTFELDPFGTAPPNMPAEEMRKRIALELQNAFMAGRKYVDADLRELRALAERFLRLAHAGGWPVPSEIVTRATRLGVPVADL